MAYCGEHTIVKGSEVERIAVSLRCRAWTCPDCVDDRKRGLIAQCHGGAPNTFLTLSCRVRPGDSPDAWALRLSHAWRLLRLRWMHYGPELWAWRNRCEEAKAAGRPLPDKPRLPRKNGKIVPRKLPFVAVVEATKLGWPHLHIMLRSVWISQEWISAVMAELIDSPVVDIRRIDNKAKVAGYVAKYCGKAAHKFATAKRYWKSVDYDLRTDRSVSERSVLRGTWEKNPDPLHRIIYWWKHAGWAVESVSQFKAIARRPP